MNSLFTDVVPNSSIDITDTAVGTILDNDAAAVTIENVSVSEDGTMTFAATLNSDVQGGFDVDVVFANATAGNADYNNNTQTLSFTGTAGEVVQFTVPLVDDAIVEINESFNVSMNNLVPSVVPTSSIDITDTAVGTITNDDSASVSIENVTVAEDGTMTFSATLDQAVDGGFSVDVQFADATATGADYDSSSQTLSFNGTAGEVIPVHRPFDR